MSAQNSFSFNYFKHLNRNVSKNLQQYPHYDQYFNAIFYIDPYENGGTALYENLDLENKEDENILIDISHLKIKKIIKSVQNRCVIFPGHCLHGGYIEDHNKYYYNWRINMVNFFKRSPLCRLSSSSLSPGNGVLWVVPDIVNVFAPSR